MSSPLSQRFSLLVVTFSIVMGLPMTFSSPAHAGILDFLFGGGRGGGNASGRRSGGAVRDECPINAADGTALDFSSFQALTPDNNQMLTANRYPTFWFNVPFSASPDLQYVEFMLLHHDDKSYALDQPIYFNVPVNPGIVQFQLPMIGKGLERDRAYQWFFSLQCDEVELSRNPVLTGTIEYPSSLPVNQQPWPDALLSEVGDRTSPDWQEFINAETLIPVNFP